MTKVFRFVLLPVFICLSGIRISTAQPIRRGSPTSSGASLWRTDAVPSILDTTFGTGGTTIDSVRGGNLLNASSQSVAIQKDGRIIVAGTLSGNFYNAPSINAIAIARYDTDGTLDTTFGTGGKVRTATAATIGNYDGSESVVIEPGGKILVAGTTKNASGHDEIILARYTTAGTLDNTFGTSGISVAGSGGVSGDYDASELVLLPDGKIVVAGTSSNGFLLVRYDSNGTVDNTFGTNGFAITAISGGTGNDVARSVAVQPDGKIVVAGYSDRSSGSISFALARFDSDGTIDAGFGTNGTVATTVENTAGANSSGESVAIQPDGKIVVAGYVSDANGSKFALVRYDTSGSPDSSFAVDGVATASVAGGSGKDIGYSVRIDAYGRIVVGGYASSGLRSSLEMARFKSDGSPDGTFGTDGTSLVDVSGGTGETSEAAIGFQPDGKIVETATTHMGGQTVFALVRCDTDGTADNTFGTGGSLTTSFGGAPYNDRVNAVVLLPDNKVLAAGTSGGEFALARLNENGTPDTSFGNNGTVRSIVGTSGQGQAVAVQSDGKIILAGSCTGITTSAVTVARYDKNGTLDNTFGDNGVAKEQIGGGDGNDYGNAVAIQPDGKIVVGATTYNKTNFVFGILRLNSDGTLDKSFAVNGAMGIPISGGDAADNCLSIALLPDGKIALGGYSHNSSGVTFAVALCDSDGKPDESFGTNGTVRVPINGSDGTGDYGMSVAATPDGDIAIAGQSRYGKDNAFAVALLDTTGALVRSFGDNGTVTTAIPGGDGTGDYGYSVAAQPDGKILVGGESHGSAGYQFALVRYNADGSPDSTFNGNGIVRIPIEGSNGTNDMGKTVAVARNGKIILAGSAAVPDGTMMALARFLPGTEAFANALPATQITDSSAVIAGEIFPHGMPTTARFLYGTKPGSYADSAEATPSTAAGDTITTFSLRLSGLSPATAYYYTISGNGGTASYLAGNQKRFTTHYPVPVKPVLLSPDGVTGVPRRATLTWSSSAYARSYTLEISSGETFAAIIFDTTSTDTVVHLALPLADTTRYYWRVSAAGESGTSGYSAAGLFTTGTGLDAVDQQPPLPRSYALFQNYPNPFNPTTTIKFALPTASRVTMRVYDVLGRMVGEPVNARLQAGYHELEWDGWRFASGVYFYRLTAQALDGTGKSFVQTKKLLLVK